MKKTKFIKSMTSLFLVIAIILSCGTTGICAVHADDGTGIGMTKSGIVGGNITASRYNGNTFNIINDGSGGNTTVGLWSYDISDASKMTGAQLTATVTDYAKQNIDGLAIDFYYINPSSANAYLKDINESAKHTNLSGINTNAGDSSISYIKSTFKLSNKNLLGSLAHNYSSNENNEFTLDLTTAIHDMKKNSWNGLCILAMCNKNNGASESNPNWSDTWIKLSNITYTVSSTALSISRSAVISAGESNQRYNGNSFNIVNDGTASCTTIGLWSYGIDSLKYVDSASLNVYVNDYYKASINDLSVNFYYIDPSLASSYLKDASVSNKTSVDSNLANNVGDNAVGWAENKFGLTNSTKIGTISHNYASAINRYTTLDLTSAFNRAKQEKWSEICVLAVCSKNNNGATTNEWSDSWIEPEFISYNESDSYIPIGKSGILCGQDGGTRYNSTAFNIVNDSLPGNTTVGLWSYDITDIKSGDKASVAATSSKWSQDKIDNFGVELYWIDSAKASQYLKPLNQTLKHTTHSGIATNAGANSTAYIKQLFGLSDTNKIGYIDHDYRNDNNKYVTLDLTTAVKNAKTAGINDITVVAFCNRNNNGTNENGKWSDIWLELNGINYGADLGMAEIQPLKSAMAEYEAKMSGGKLYTNMGTAYNAYVNAQKAIDAYLYGNVKSLNIAQYTNTLKSALASMKEWSAPTANATPRFSSSDNGTIPANTGCLWYESSNDPLVRSYSAEGNNTTANFYYHTGVYLYSDSSPNIPFLVGFYRTSSSTFASPQKPRVFYMALREQNGGLRIRNSQYQGDVCSRDFNTVINSPYQINSSEEGTSSNIVLSTGDMRYMANFFNINYDAAFGGGGYYTTAAPTQFSVGIGTSDGGNSVQWVKYIDGVNTKNFYIINYKPLLEKINTASYRVMVKNPAAYKQGGLSQLMSAYDAATAVNPSSYNYASSTATSVANCATQIKNAVNKFNQVSSITKDNTAYNTLRNALTNAEKTGQQNGVISSSNAQATRYTNSTWNVYYSALTQGQGAMASVISASGYSGAYNSKSVTVLANDITNAISSLKYNYIVEYISAGGQNMGSLVVEEGQTADSSSIVNTATIKGVQERQAHIIYSWNEVTADRATYGDNEVITVNETRREEACQLTLGDVIKKPTCSEPGIRQSTCDICGAVYETETDKLEHTYKSEIVPSSCTERGYTLHTCIHCGESYKDNYTELTDHTYENVVVPPTCTERGYTAQKCTVCGHEQIDENSYVDALGHEYEYSVIREPDCTFKGVGEYVCVRGDSSYTEEISENENNHGELVYSRTVQPTASEQGYDIYYCNNLCGYWEKRNFTEPTKTDAEFTDCLEAYNASLLTIVNNFDAYTEESKATYLNAINDAKANGEAAIDAKDASALDRATASIIEATALLRIRTISVKLMICNANGEIVESQSRTESASYGDLVKFDISEDIGDLNVQKWTIKKDGVTRKVSQGEATCELIANSNATVCAYLTEKEVEPSTNIKLTLLNNDGRVIGTKYITSSDSLDTSKKEIAGICAPKLPFNTFKQWKTVNVKENEIVLRATYEVI